MARKKMDDSDKKVSIGITINPELYKLLETYTIENNISKSKLIENIMSDYIKKNKINYKYYKE